MLRRQAGVCTASEASPLEEYHVYVGHMGDRKGRKQRQVMEQKVHSSVKKFLYLLCTVLISAGFLSIS